MSDTLILIPARFQSARFPGKPLAPLDNVPMIKRVHELCLATGFDSYVVTDNEQIENCVKEYSQNVLRVDDDVESGTERIELAFRRFFKSSDKYGFIINVQGDEPLLKPDSIKRLRQEHGKSSFDVMTLVRKEIDQNLSNDPNKVKAVYSSRDQRCLYFSRSLVPFYRANVDDKYWYHHLGVYSYKVASLSEFVSFEPSRLEKIEKLEQLRGMENGLSYGAIEIFEKTFGVDHPDDIKKVEEILVEKTN